MSKKMTSITLAVVMAGVIALSSAPSTIAAGDFSHNFTESFSTTMYRNAGNTNASGWGADFVRLPSKPVSYVSGETSDTVPREVDISGAYAFVASATKIEVFNIANPLNMVSAVNVTRSGMEPCAVDVEGSYLYVAGGNGGFFVYNIATPTSPSFVTSRDDGGVYQDVLVVGTTAYLSTYSNGLKTYDITNPASLPAPNIRNDGGDYYGLSVAGNYLYVAVASAGMSVYNLTTNPKIPVYITTLDLAGFAKDVHAVGSYAYVACDLRGMYVISVANPAAPAQVGYYDFPRARDVQVVGNYAFLACEDASMTYTYMGLVILDISVPTAPTHKGTYNLPASDAAQGLIVSGNYTYVCSVYHFDCFDVSPLFYTVYASSASAESLSFETRTWYSTFWSATLTLTATIPSQTQVSLFLSADGGGHWEPATSGVEHVFATPGFDIRWRAILTSSKPSSTPVLDTVQIVYTYSRPSSPNVVSPGTGDTTTNPRPTFIWDKLGTLDEYLFQVSVDSADFIALLVNQTVSGSDPTVSYSMPSSIEINHIYYWRVAAIDQEGHVGEFSQARSIIYTPSSGPGQVSGYAPLAILAAMATAVALVARKRRV